MTDPVKVATEVMVVYHLRQLSRIKLAQANSSIDNNTFCRCIEKLRALPLVQVPTLTEARASGGDQKRHAARNLTQLWASVVKVAWKSRGHNTVCLAAPYVMWLTWDEALDREMVLLQVSASVPCRCLHPTVPEKV